jgi:uncharacterized protein (TIGR03089 family)
VHQLTPERCFADLLAAAPAAPFVTYYDEATGERSELSARSLANWVAKTHFLLIDELGLGRGDAAFVALPAHWISVPAILGCLTAGLQVVEDAAAGAEVAFVAPNTAELAVGVPDSYAVAPSSAAVGLRGDTPEGVSDYVLAVRPQPDKWATVQLQAGPEDPCLAGRTRGETVERARARAAELGIEGGARILTDREWAGSDDLIDALFVPLVMGGSLVVVRNAAEDVLLRRAEQEKATVRLR